MLPTRRVRRTVPVTILLVAAGFTLASEEDPPPGPAPVPPAPKEGDGAAPAPPAEAAFQPPAILAQRRKGLKEASANLAVAAGLDWLRRHQGEAARRTDDDRRWDCDGFGAACRGPACEGQGFATFDPGVTGLAVLAFLGAGRTHEEGDDEALVAAALEYLVGIQDSDGCFGPRTDERFQYNHRVATMAVAEALWLTGDEELRGPATKARDFLLASQNPYLAWRYGVRDGDNDTSNTVYAVIALRTCEFAGLSVPADAWSGAQSWFDKMADPETGRTGYQSRGGRDARAWKPDGDGRSRQEPPPDPDDPGRTRPKVKPKVPLLPRIGGGLRTEAAHDGPYGYGGAPESVLAQYPDDRHSALTACAAAALSLTRGADAAALVNRQASFLADAPPREEHAGFLDLHYLLFGSLFHAQRPIDVRPRTQSSPKTWRPWRDAVVADLTATQRKKADACAAGSWDPQRDPFGIAGGRVYSTAMAVLALQAPNRFPKVWNPKRR